MRAIEKLRELTEFLKGCGIEAPEKEAEILVRHGLDINIVEIYRDNPELSEEQMRTVEGMLKRKLRHEPFQYILGYEEFLGLKILVGPGVLIPRPETEFVAEQVIKTVREQNTDKLHNSSISILDLCTGSGCLALALAKEFPEAQVYGNDISEVAIGYAKKNAEINGIKNVTFLKGSLFQPIEEMFTTHGSPFTFDLIISNPPYIRTDDIKNLQPEIKNWEPVVAINGGPDGLDFYRELIPVTTRFLKDTGLIMLELGADQSSNVADIIESSGYTQVEIIKDYAGIERIVIAQNSTEF